MNEAGGDARLDAGAAVVGPAGPPDPTPRMTAAHIAVAVVAACGVTGTKPERAFDNGDGQGRARVMAAAGCMARLGWSKADAARLFRVHPNRLTPSGQALARIETEHLLIIAEALAQNGLAAADDARARFLRPYGPGGGGKGDPPGHSASAAAAATPQRKAGGGEATAAAAVRAEADSAVEPRPSVVEPAPAPERTVTRIGAAAGAAIPVRPGPRQAPRSQVTERLKPVTDRVIEWTRQQLALGADVDFVAWCFSVDVEVLAARCGVAVDGRVAA